MNLGSSYDEGGPMEPLGPVSFSAETGLPGGRQVFEVPTFVASSDEAKLIVEYNGVELTDFGTWNDYYGFGTSPLVALEEAREKLEKLRGCNATISLVATIKRQPCFPSNDTPFYAGSQRIHHIPLTWRHESDRCQRSEREFVVWQDGARTREALVFYDEIMRLAAEDAAPSRKGHLRTVATRTQPTPREAFLCEADQ